MKKNVHILFFGLMLIIPVHLFAQLATNGSETVVNSTTTSNQLNPAVAMDASGNFVVVWESEDTDGSGFGIYAQRYSAGGTAAGSQMLVNSTTNGNQRFPDVAMQSTGEFMIVWMDDTKDGDGWSICYRKFTADGTADSNELNLATADTRQKKFPRITISGDDAAYFVTWATNGSDYGIRGAKVTSESGAGTVTATDIVTASSTFVTNPVIDADHAGNCVVAWQSFGSDADIKARRYDNTWTLQGSEFTANTETSGQQIAPCVGVDSSGAFVIAWTSTDQDGSGDGIYFQRYDNAGVAQGDETCANTTTSGNQNDPHVVMTQDGNFTVLWSSDSQDGNLAGLYYQSFNYGGIALGTEERVNTRTTDYQHFGHGDQFDESTELVTAWQDGLLNSTSTHDQSDYGVYLQRYDVNTSNIDLALQLSVWLEGPWDSSTETMITSLQADGHIPTTSPYTEDSRTVASIPSGVVDWVLVQLRTHPDSASYSSNSVFVNDQGALVSDDGTSTEVTVSGLPASNYVVVKHRNHLAIMSAAAIDFGSGSANYDFTGSTGQYYGTDGYKLLGTDRYGMWCGDINQDGQITTADYTEWQNQAITDSSGYQSADINADGKVTTLDYTIWYNNNKVGAASAVPE